MSWLPTCYFRLILLGLLIRTLKEYWSDCLYLACALYPHSQNAGHSYHLYQELIKQVNAHELGNIWKLRPLVKVIVVILLH